MKEAWAGCKELDSDVQRKWVEAKQCLTVLRQLGRTGILTLHALQELDGGGLSLAALRACGCVISRSDFATFMLWLQSADVHLLDKVHPISGIEQFGRLDLSDFSQLSQPVGCDRVPMLAPSMPPNDLPRVAGACSYAGSKYASQ